MAGKIREYQFNAQGGVSSVSFINTPTVSGGAVAWGDITGTLATQADVYAQITSRALIATLSTAAFTVSSIYATSTHTHSASDITSSTLAVARMGTSTANVSTFLAGTGVWLQPVYTSLLSLPTLGTAASTAASDYATSTHAHSASNITSSTLALARMGGGTTNVSTFLDGTGNFSQPSFSSLANMPVLGTAASTAAAAYATSTQGAKADAAAPSSTLSSAAYTLSTMYAISTHNISSATHTFPGGNTFLRADGVFATPAGGASNISTIKTTSLVFTTTTSSLPITGFGFTVSNTIAYSFEFGLTYAAAISSTGLRVGLQYPATSSFAANVEIPAVVATGTDSRTQGYIIVSASSVVAPSTPLSSTKYIANVYGQILPSANGTLQFCYATAVAGSAISSFAGSYGILTTL